MVSTNFEHAFISIYIACPQHTMHVLNGGVGADE